MQNVSYYIINAFCLVDKMFDNLTGSWKVVKKATGTGAEWREQESSKWVRKVTVTSLGHVLLVAAALSVTGGG